MRSVIKDVVNSKTFPLGNRFLLISSGAALVNATLSINVGMHLQLGRVLCIHFNGEFKMNVHVMDSCTVLHIWKHFVK